MEYNYDNVPSQNRKPTKNGTIITDVLKGVLEGAAYIAGSIEGSVNAAIQNGKRNQSSQYPNTTAPMPQSEPMDDAQQQMPAMSIRYSGNGMSEPQYPLRGDENAPETPVQHDNSEYGRFTDFFSLTDYMEARGIHWGGHVFEHGDATDINEGLLSDAVLGQEEPISPTVDRQWLNTHLRITAMLNGAPVTGSIGIDGVESTLFIPKIVLLENENKGIYSSVHSISPKTMSTDMIAPPPSLGQVIIHMPSGVGGIMNPHDEYMDAASFIKAIRFWAWDRYAGATLNDSIFNSSDRARRKMMVLGSQEDMEVTGVAMKVLRMDGNEVTGSFAVSHSSPAVVLMNWKGRLMTVIRTHDGVASRGIAAIGVQPAWQWFNNIDVQKSQKLPIYFI